MAREPKKSIKQVIDADGRYPLPAVQFVREGLSRTVELLYPQSDPNDAESRRHVSGPELCHGLRQLAFDRWGMLARSVLQRWNITETKDFGEIVFLLIESGWMQKEPQDCLEDFENVYDFAAAFESDFEITDET